MRENLIWSFWFCFVCHILPGCAKRLCTKISCCCVLFKNIVEPWYSRPSYREPWTISNRNPIMLYIFKTDLKTNIKRRTLSVSGLLSVFNYTFTNKDLAAGLPGSANNLSSVTLASYRQLTRLVRGNTIFTGYIGSSTKLIRVNICDEKSKHQKLASPRVRKSCILIPNRIHTNAVRFSLLLACSPPIRTRHGMASRPAYYAMSDSPTSRLF